MRARPLRSRRSGVALALAGLLAGCADSGAPDDKSSAVQAPEVASIVPAEQALAGAELARLDPAVMNDAEIRSALGMGPRCEFRYTRAGRPVLAARMRANEAPTRGVVKLNGKLVAFDPGSGDGTHPNATVLSAGPVRITVTSEPTPGAERHGRLEREADMMFEADEKRRIGYRGYFSCITEPPMTSDRR